jgi:oligoendopeptidase F
MLTGGEPLRPFTDVSDLEEGAQRIFTRVDPIFGEYFSIMRDGFLDLPSRPNKAPGGYCEGFPVTGRPYIFMNAAGAPTAVSTLLHEGGHAFHFMDSRRHPLVWNHNGPMEFCEVASMSMELLSAPYLAANEGGFYSEPDARRAYRDNLRNIVEFLPYMAVVERSSTGLHHRFRTCPPRNWMKCRVRAGYAYDHGAEAGWAGTAATFSTFRFIMSSTVGNRERFRSGATPGDSTGGDDIGPLP